MYATGVPKSQENCQQATDTGGGLFTCSLTSSRSQITPTLVSATMTKCKLHRTIISLPERIAIIWWAHKRPGRKRSRGQERGWSAWWRDDSIAAADIDTESLRVNEKRCIHAHTRKKSLVTYRTSHVSSRRFQTSFWTLWCMFWWRFGTRKIVPLLCAWSSIECEVFFDSISPNLHHRIRFFYPRATTWTASLFCSISWTLRSTPNAWSIHSHIPAAIHWHMVGCPFIRQHAHLSASTHKRAYRAPTTMYTPQTDPFSRKPLTEAELVPNTELRGKTQAEQHSSISFTRSIDIHQLNTHRHISLCTQEICPFHSYNTLHLCFCNVSHHSSSYRTDRIHKWLADHKAAKTTNDDPHEPSTDA